VIDAGVVKYRAFGNEPATHIERLGVTLCIKHDLMVPKLSCTFDKRLEYSPTYTLPSGAVGHSHAAYVPVWQQAAGTDHAAIREASHCMQAGRIELVPFKLRRHALLLNEHIKSHGQREWLR